MPRKEKKLTLQDLALQQLPQNERTNFYKRNAFINPNNPVTQLYSNYNGKDGRNFEKAYWENGKMYRKEKLDKEVILNKMMFPFNQNLGWEQYIINSTNLTRRHHSDMLDEFKGKYHPGQYFAP